MQLVVLIAVKNAVSAATITFTATSIIRFFIIHLQFYFLNTNHTNLTNINPARSKKFV